MPQSFPAITATTKLQDSLQPILDRDTSARSSNSGTAFPTTDLELGMLCYRTDQGALYVLKQITPTVTWEPLLQSTGAGSIYLPLAGGTLAGSISLTATGAERQIRFVTGAGNNTTYLFGRPADNVIGLYNQQNTTSVWEYAPASNTFNVAATNFTKGGNTVWHAANDGAGSGLDADLLDGQDGAFYRNYTNLTNRPTLGTAAALNTGDLQAFVDLSSRVAKTGDTMTGNLRAPAFRAAKGVPNFADGSTTGYAFAGDGDTGMFALGGTETTGTTQINFFIDNGLDFIIQNDGNLWSASYGWLHDRFARRETVLGNGANRVTGNCGNITLSAGDEVYDTGDGRHQIRRFFVNCTNCDCDTGGGGNVQCVAAGTLVLLTTLEWKPVQDLAPGDRLDDGVGGEAVVIGLHTAILGQRRLMRVNDVLMSADHPLLTDNGWVAVDTEGVRRSTEVIDALHGQTQRVVSFYEAAYDPALRTLAHGMPLHTIKGAASAVIETVEGADPTMLLYSPIVIGSGSFVSGGLVSGTLRATRFISGDK